MNYDRNSVTGALELGNAGDTNPVPVADAQLDALGTNRIIVGPRRLEHLPGVDPDDVERRADALGVLDPGAHFDTFAFYDRVGDRTRSRSARVRRLHRATLLRRLSRRLRSDPRRAAAAAVAGRRRAGVGPASASLTGAL